MMSPTATSQGSATTRGAAANVAARIAESLRTQIRAGKLAVGDRLPPERELAKQMGVASATVQKAIKELEAAGLVEGQPGRGRFVADWRRSKTWAVAVLLYDTSHLGHPVMLQRLGGMQPPLEDAGYHIHFIAMNRNAGDGEQDWLTLIDPARYDGAIVVAHQVPSQQVFRLAERMPVVWMDQHSVKPGLLGVRSDMLGGGLLAGEHLAQLGHRNIALLNANKHALVHIEQHEGMQLAARRTPGMSVRWLNVISSSDHDAIRKVIAEAFSGQRRPTALVCGADDFVPTVLEQLQNMGLRVPEDVSLVGWNDTLQPPAVPVPMTCIRVDFKAVGNTAATVLRDMLSGDAPESDDLEGQIAPAELLVRASTLPVRGQAKQ